MNPFIFGNMFKKLHSNKTGNCYNSIASNCIKHTFNKLNLWGVNPDQVIIILSDSSHTLTDSSHTSSYSSNSRSFGSHSCSFKNHFWSNTTNDERSSNAA
jgi:uracil DNA glycosylase